MVYFLHREKRPGHALVYGYKALDGDYGKVRPVDMTRDEGKRFSACMPSQGRPVETDFLPTRVQVEGPKRQLADVQANFLNWMVNDSFKEVLERLEPGVHQWNPVTLEWSDGSIAAKRWWLHICNRIDSVDEEKTTFTKNNLWLTDGDPSKTLVFSRSKIGNRHIWIDKFLTFGPYVSETFKREMEAAGVTGLGFKPWPETD